MSGKHSAKYKKLAIRLPKQKLTIYAGKRVLSALEEIMKDMTLYEGVRLSQVMETFYEHGVKDGRKEIIEQFDSIKRKTNYLPPGRPRLSRKK